MAGGETKQEIFLIEEEIITMLTILHICLKEMAEVDPTDQVEIKGQKTIIMDKIIRIRLEALNLKCEIISHLMR